MPNVKSAEKRVRQGDKRRARNRAGKSTMRTAVKKARTNPEDGQLVLTALSHISRMAKRGIIHPKTASRLTSRLQIHANKAKASA